MKVVQENHSQMTLRLLPWSMWLFGAFLTSAGLIFAGLGVTEETFSCRRDTTAPATCQLSSKGVLWSNPNYDVFPLKDIQGTKIDNFTDYEDQRRYRLLILTNSREISPINTDFSAQKRVREWQEDIELFLKDTQRQNLVIEYNNRFYIYVIAVVLTVAGLVIAVIFSKVFLCNIDKTLGKLTLAKYGLVSGSKAEYKIFDIRGITLQTPEDNSEGIAAYRVALVMKSGEYIPIISNYSFGAKILQQQQIADRISQFLNLEFIQVMSVPEIFSTLEDIPRLLSMNQEECDAKLAYLQQAIMNNGNDAEANYLYGLALGALQRYQEAQPFLEAAKRLFGWEGKKQRVQEIDSLLTSRSQKL
ncbi:MULTISPECIES: hypothetical protein [unclassified Nodularia (in: cyanobacteria)]|uniref:tetratricopeptide repeat protein n=1 Tax=unclassified Nodularia (in: cyanobacteria) TaxID=2656917 RepID=UPI001880C763|nr:MULTISPECIES: hypothetical protein [unclassified Nodularia (in: cyanobacteria)]MBE9201112.1 hypothetical protein [Nodularia sp. LEGE 06071]MCC2694817.1 hypothetical protein [Nodularia sp. LEGE 04288]